MTPIRIKVSRRGGGEFPCPDDEDIPANNANGRRIVGSGPVVFTLFEALFFCFSFSKVMIDVSLVPS